MNNLSHTATWSKPSWKTWTDLLGPFDSMAGVDASDIILPTGTYRGSVTFKILWHFATAEQATAAFEHWRIGR